MSQTKLLASPRFAPVFWTQFFGALNDNVLKNALVILIEFRAADVFGLSPAQMVSLSGGIFILPFFLFSATAGQLADAMEKAKLMRIVKWTEVAIMALATAGFAFQQIGFLLFCLFMMGMHSTFFGPIKYSILPQTLDDKDLVGGNALVESGTFLAILIGTIVGGQLIAIPAYGGYAASAALIAIAALGLFASYRVPSTPVGAPDLRVRLNPFPPTLEILRDIAGNRTILNSILAASWFWFFGSIVLSLFPAYCREFLGASESGVTLFLAAFSIGIGAGSLLCERLSGHRVEIGLVPFGSLGMSAFAFDLWLREAPPHRALPYSAINLIAEPSVWRILIDVLGLSIFSGLFIVPLYALLQERTPLARRSRVIAANNVVNALFMVVAAGMTAGLLALRLTVPQLFGVAAALNLAVAVYVYSVVPEFFLRFCAYILANFVYSLETRDGGRVPARGPCVLVCNHVSFVDWLVIYAGVRRPVRFVMHKNFVARGVVGFLMRQARTIPIAGAKEDPAMLERAFARVREELLAGEIVCIFPEGSITRDGELGAFRPGIERIVRETPVPVVPMALGGLWHSFFSRNADARRKRRFPWLLWMPVTLNIGEPVAAENVTAAGLRERVAAQISQKSNA